MKKVGVLSMQRVANYGSFWQAYCLKEMILKLLPCQVEFIDIIPGEVEAHPKKKTLSALFKKVKKAPYYLFSKKKRKMFRAFQKEVLNLPDEKNYSDAYDAVIIGSDEVFNFVQRSPWGFSTQLYGDINNSCVSSYAACFGYTTMDDVEKYGRAEAIAKSLNNMVNISVRDQNSFQIVKALIGREAAVNLDPVIVGDLPENLPEIRDTNYVLIYSYDYRMSDPEIIRKTRTFAKSHGLKIISAGFYQTWVDKNVLPDPEQLLSYFKNAEYVITDTFHGTIFSMRMHKQFVTVIRDTNINKLSDLLHRVGVDNRCVSADDNIDEILTEKIDFDAFEDLRAFERKKTDDYLLSCLTE